MIYVNVILTVRDAADVNEIRGLLKRQGEMSRAEPGCARFEVYQSKNDPKLFVLSEHWESQEALDVHREAAAYQTVYKPLVLPKVDRAGHPCDLVQ